MKADVFFSVCSSRMMTSAKKIVYKYEARLLLALKISVQYGKNGKGG